MNSLSENLKFFRVQNNLKQSDLAVKLNITQRAYSFYETGRSEPKIDILLKIAELYRIPLDVLVGRKYDNMCNMNYVTNNNQNSTISITMRG